MPGTPHSLLRRLLAVSVGLTLGVAALEAALRLAGIPAVVPPFALIRAEGADANFEPDAALFWRLRTDSAKYRGAPPGVRGWWPAGPATDGTLRVLCLGDSSTFGVGVLYEHCYALRLEQRLQRDRPLQRVECLIGGLPGHSSHQTLQLFRHHGRQLAPDVVVAYLGAWNDHRPASERSDAAWSRHLAAAADPWVPRIWLAGERLRGRLRGETGLRVPLADFVHNLDALVRDARAAGAAVVLLVPPLHPAGIEANPIARDYRAAVRARAGRGVTVIDAAALLEDAHTALPAAATGGATDVFLDWVHPTARGHDMLATALAEAIDDLTPPAIDGAFASALAGSVAPTAVDALAPGTLSVRTEAPVDERTRVWIGERWASDVTRQGPELRVSLPALLLPGKHLVELRTEHGPHTVGHLRVRAPPLEVEITGAEGARQVHLKWSGPAGWHALAWLAPTVRPSPAQTRFGPIHLDLPFAPGVPPMVELPPAPIALELDDRGHATTTLPSGASTGQLHIQGVLLWPEARRVSSWPQAQPGLATAAVTVTL